MSVGQIEPLPDEGLKTNEAWNHRMHYDFISFHPAKAQRSNKCQRISDSRFLLLFMSIWRILLNYLHKAQIEGHCQVRSGSSENWTCWTKKNRWEGTDGSILKSVHTFGFVPLSSTSQWHNYVQTMFAELPYDGF